MTAGELIELIPSETFRDLAIETKVDTQVKKLSGEIIFKLILFSMLNSDKLSLRVMETFLQSAKFKVFTKYDILDGKYNSIRDRICTINADYFEKLFEKIFAIYNKELKEESALIKTDSTCVSLAAKLLDKGIAMGSPNRKFVKYTVNLKGSIPSSVKVFTEQPYANDESAMAQLINDKSCKGDVVVFDRGIQSRSTFDKITASDKLFVTRGLLNIRCSAIEYTDVPPRPKGSLITLSSDQTGLLDSQKHKKTKYRYRIIKGTVDKTQSELCFITNIMDEDAYTIAQWYRKRWEIEVFFKFIKQHLNVRHLISRDANGIKVMIYMTMILAILLIAYKKLNNLKGFKIPKLKFELELENEVMKAIVVLCGGDPAKAPHLFNSA